jgi:hypothetical protein
MRASLDRLRAASATCPAIARPRARACPSLTFLSVMLVYVATAKKSGTNATTRSAPRTSSSLSLRPALKVPTILDRPQEIPSGTRTPP